MACFNLPLDRLIEAWSPLERSIYSLLVKHGLVALRGAAPVSLFLRERDAVTRPVWIAEFGGYSEVLLEIIHGEFSRLDKVARFRVVEIDTYPAIVCQDAIAPTVIIFFSKRYCPQIPLDAGCISAGRIRFRMTPSEIYAELTGPESVSLTAIAKPEFGAVTGQLESQVNAWYVANLAHFRASYATREDFERQLAGRAGSVEPSFDLKLIEIRTSLPALIIGRIEAGMNCRDLEQLLTRLTNFKLSSKDKLELSYKLVEVVKNSQIMTAVGLAVDTLVTL